MGTTKKLNGNKTSSLHFFSKHKDNFYYKEKICLPLRVSYVISCVLQHSFFLEKLDTARSIEIVPRGGPLLKMGGLPLELINNFWGQI